jgi:N6-L-threonylcarbamoyladenine synthase
MGTAKTLTLLGIETSCDETAAAVVVRDGAGVGRILSNVVRAQWEQHRPYGGVVPELASRAHVECLDEIIGEAMQGAGLGFADLDGIAVTAGPGLIGGLMVGVVTAETIALVHDLPLVAVNHLEAHALTVGLTEGLPPPYLLLLVSGGHTQLLAVKDVGSYVRLGSTIDDALGEAFDKTAKLLGLGGWPCRRTDGGHGLSWPVRSAAALVRTPGAELFLLWPEERRSPRCRCCSARQRPGHC